MKPKLKACPKCGGDEFYLPRSVDRQQYHWSTSELEHRAQWTRSVAGSWNLECINCGDKSLKIYTRTGRITAGKKK